MQNLNENFKESSNTNIDKSLLKFYLFTIFATFLILVFWLINYFKEAKLYSIILAFACLVFLLAAAAFIFKKLFSKY